MARYKILRVWPDIFVNMCIEGTDKVRIIQNALPYDTKYVRAYINDSFYRGEINIVVESSEWPELEDGEKIPNLPYPTFEKING